MICLAGGSLGPIAIGAGEFWFHKERGGRSIDGRSPSVCLQSVGVDPQPYPLLWRCGHVPTDSIETICACLLLCAIIDILKTKRTTAVRGAGVVQREGARPPASRGLGSIHGHVHYRDVVTTFRLTQSWLCECARDHSSSTKYHGSHPL